MTLRRLEYFKTLIDMELTLKRETFTEESTIGSLYIDGVFVFNSTIDGATSGNNNYNR